ncbi:hypothetical protein ACFL47_08185, partial [Candidatus Latescibacterota bacterium]
MNIIAKYSLILLVAAIGVTGQLLLRKAMGNFNNMQLDNFVLNIQDSIPANSHIRIMLLCNRNGCLSFFTLKASNHFRLSHYNIF